MIGTSPGQTGTAAAQQHLRNILSPQQMITMGQPEVYLHWRDGLLDEAGHVADDAVRTRLNAFLDRFALWIERMAQK